MNQFTDLIKRFALRYRRLIGLSLFFNIAEAATSIFSFGLIIPLLNILFKTHTETAGNPHSFINNSFIFNKISSAFEWMLSHNGAVSTLFLIGLIFLVMTGIRNACLYLGDYFMIPVRTGIIKDIRLQIEKKILSLDVAWFTDRPHGDIISRMTTDARLVDNTIVSSLRLVGRDSLLIVIYMVFLFVLDWRLAIFALCLLPITGYFINKAGKQIKYKSLKVQQQWGLLLNSFGESISGLRIIKTFNAEHLVQAKFGAISESLRKLSNKMYRRQSLAEPLTDMLTTLSLVIIMCIAGIVMFNVHNNTFNASIFIWFLTLYYNTIIPSKQFYAAIFSIKRGLAPLERINELLNAENEIVEKGHPQPATFKKQIVFKQVKFSYPKANKAVLSDINIIIPHGKTIALVGHSGCGKSSLANLLLRFYDVSQGEILIDGRNIKTLGLKDWRHQIGYVTQENILFNDTIFNNLIVGIDKTDISEVQDATRIACAHDFITQLPQAYHSYVGDRGIRLSGGEIQRICIARALLKKPEFLILDEATAALDNKTEKEVITAIHHLMRDKTCLIISHKLSNIVDADYIYVLKDGKIIEEGKHQDLYHADKYYKQIFDYQNITDNK